MLAPLEADKSYNCDFLESGLIYRGMGFSVVPLKGDKTPLGRWKHLMHRRLSDKELGRRISGNTTVQGVGLVVGRISGGLACRDFDRPEAFHRWRSENPAYAHLPVDRTHRGYHVWLRSPFQHHATYGDGEYLGDGRHYVTAPPTVNPAGTVHRWLSGHIPSPDSFPLINPRTAGLLRCYLTPEERQKTPEEDTETAAEREDMFCGSDIATRISERLEGDDQFSATVGEAVARCLPLGEGQRNHCLWRLSGKLKAIEPDVRVDEWRSVVRWWWSLSLPVIGTKEWETTWSDFRRQWAKQWHPSRRKGSFQVDESQDAAERLRAYCRHLAGEGGTFFLSRRSASQVTGVPEGTIRYHLGRLVKSGFLELTAKGIPAKRVRQASTYRLLAE